MTWTVGDVSGSQSLTSDDHLYHTHINELRTGVDARLQLAGDIGGTAALPKVNTRSATVTVGPSSSYADYIASGTSDHTVINTALNAAASAKASFRAGTFDIQGLVSPKTGNTIVGEGWGTLFQLGSGTGKTFKPQSVSHLTFRDFRIDGTNIASSNAYGMFVDQCDDILIDHIWVVNCNGFGLFLNQSNSSTHGKIRVVNCYLSGLGNCDVLGGGPSDATSTLSELIIADNHVLQNVNSTGTYYNAIDIVSQNKTVIANNVTQGNIILGGEKIPHFEVNVTGNVVNPAPGGSVARIAVLCASNASETDDSSCITIANNQINGSTNGGQIFVQGQSSTSSRTRKVNIKGNTINGTTTNTEQAWGIELSYMADVIVEGNTVDGAFRGIYVNDIQGIDISNNRFINCTTPIVLGGTVPTNMTGHNNVGINPDVLYAQGNVTGATTFSRVNGQHITATLTGNITVTFPDTYFKGELMILELTQDGTGSRTVTWPSNFKKAGGSLTLSTAAGAKDVITMRWDGTNWVEVSRALAVA
jgi:parallel beta-helix repeat protein